MGVARRSDTAGKPWSEGWRAASASVFLSGAGVLRPQPLAMPRGGTGSTSKLRPPMSPITIVRWG